MRETQEIWLHFIKKHNIKAHLHVIIVGDNSASTLYINKKTSACEKVEVDSTVHILKETTTQKQLLNLIDSLNEDKNCHGILVQSPLPNSMDFEVISQRVSPEKDVDGFHAVNRGRHLLKQSCFIPCTTLGISRLLSYYDIDVSGKNIAMFGRSPIVGLPTFISLNQQNATVTLWHSQSDMSTFQAQLYDIIILATGQDMSALAATFLPQHIIIDVGIFSQNGKVQGDLRGSADNLNVKAITPVPGGIGPMTVNSLIFNTITAYLKLSGNISHANIVSELFNLTLSLKMIKNHF